MKTMIKVTLCAALVMASGTPALAAQSAHQHEQAMAADLSAAPQITARGEVKAIDLQSNKITLSHPAIPEVDWPAMTMRFTFDQESQVAGLKVGDRVTFSFVQQGAISRLTAIHVI
ncbi:copper-binding protein [Edwardsiella piscicida]|uniref:copper-binding protein n=1 Tax=Edwardsiella piscicida TaxID=1263550 RepID=UPI00084CAF52|nr:copper-binding protein [Edwardsiella piscicida]AOP42970.1 copper-binding protein [Edwardsiella piscicida]EKS7768107.1 copper-binding protein [Edwardsiella piscicida]UCQ32776.1 copper-binding protein [Edwardsiella piscicida]UCQ59095.1 copper-binding protein [Edwardsiella piscicida]